MQQSNSEEKAAAMLLCFGNGSSDAAATISAASATLSCRMNLQTAATMLQLMMPGHSCQAQSKIWDECGAQRNGDIGTCSLMDTTGADRLYVVVEHPPTPFRRLGLKADDAYHVPPTAGLVFPGGAWSTGMETAKLATSLSAFIAARGACFDCRKAP
mmetsp:Transcript_1995/g.5866  ORF Transcript_1995/g.5866 Transcript_1995/m.5866 type:complete len:157 (+) Transcript_1995:769-1239(+)